MKHIKEEVWKLIEKHAGHGLVNMRALERDCGDLPFDGEDIDITIEKLCNGALAWSQ